MKKNTAHSDDANLVAERLTTQHWWGANRVCLHEVAEVEDHGELAGVAVVNGPGDTAEYNADCSAPTTPSIRPNRGRRRRAAISVVIGGIAGAVDHGHTCKLTVILHLCDLVKSHVFGARPMLRHDFFGDHLFIV